MDRSFSLETARTHRRTPPRDATWHATALLGFLTLVAIVALAAGFVMFVRTVEQARPLGGQKAQGIVALTGGADRISVALDLLASGRAERLLITGVNQSTTRGEIARLTPEFRRLFTCCIDLGYEARNTIGNAEETRVWARAHHMRSLIVVTADYHMPRALAEIGHALPDASLTPYPVATTGVRGLLLLSNPPMLRVLAFEYMKYVAALIRTRVLPEPPAPA